MTLCIVNFGNCNVSITDNILAQHSVCFAKIKLKFTALTVAYWFKTVQPL